MLVSLLKLCNQPHDSHQLRQQWETQKSCALLDSIEQATIRCDRKRWMIQFISIKRLQWCKIWSAGINHKLRKLNTWGRMCWHTLDLRLLTWLLRSIVVRHLKIQDVWLKPHHGPRKPTNPSRGTSFSSCRCIQTVMMDFIFWLLSTYMKAMNRIHGIVQLRQMKFSKREGGQHDTVPQPNRQVNELSRRLITAAALVIGWRWLWWRLSPWRSGSGDKYIM